MKSKIVAAMTCLIALTVSVHAAGPGTTDAAAAEDAGDAGSSGPSSLHTQSNHGFIGCAVGFYSIASVDRCEDIHQQGSNKWVIPLEPGTKIRTIHYRLEWTPTSPLTAPALQISLPQPWTNDYTVEVNGQYIVPGEVLRGASPLWITLQSSSRTDPLFWAGPSTSLHFLVRAAGSSSEQILDDPQTLGGASGLVLNQPYEQCLVWSERLVDVGPDTAC